MPIPRKRRWLIISIIILIVVNVAYFLFIKLNYKDRLVQQYLKLFIEKETGGEVSLSHFTFNDKFILVQDFHLHVPQNNLAISAAEIRIEFDLFKFLWRINSSKNLFEEITIDDPVFSYKIQPGEKEEKREEQDILPDLHRFFTKLRLRNGSIHFAYYSKEVEFAQDLKEVYATLQTLTGITGKWQAFTPDNRELKGDIDLSGRRLSSIHLFTDNYKPRHLKIAALDSLDATYNLDYIYQPDMMKLSGKVNDITLQVSGFDVKADSLKLSGNNMKMDLKSHGAEFTGVPIDFAGKLYAVTSPDIAADIHLSSLAADLSKFQSVVTGKADLEADLSGKLQDFEIEAEAWSENISVAGQKLENVNIEALITKSELTFHLKNLKWQRNDLQAEGYYNFKNLAGVTASADSLYYSISDLVLQGKMQGNFEYNTGKSSRLRIDDFSLKTPFFHLDKLRLSALYEEDRLDFELSRIYNDINILGSYDIKADSLQASLQLHRFNLGNSLDIYTFPTVSGDIECESNRKNINFSSNIRFFDHYFGKFDGRIKASARIDIPAEKSSLQVYSSDAHYNYKKINFQLAAEGNLDSLVTSEFNINDEVFLQSTLFLQPEFNWKTSLSADGLELESLMKYFVSADILDQFKGTIELDIQADSRDEGDFKAIAAMDDLQVAELQNLNVELFIKGNQDSLSISRGNLAVENRQQGFLSGAVFFTPEFSADLNLKTENLLLQELLKNSGIEGKINTELNYLISATGNSINLKLMAENIKTPYIELDNLALDLSQSDSLLTVRHLQAAINKQSSFKAQGAIGYNILTTDSFDSPETLDLEFKGNTFSLLAHALDYVESGKSSDSLNITINMSEQGLNINNAYLNIKGNKLKLENQLENINKVDIELRIVDNVLNLRNFSVEIGNGKLIIDNSVGYNEYDLKLHQINLGQLLIYTPSRGIAFHLPQYTRENSLISLVLAGEDSPYLRFYMQNDVPVLKGNIIINQAEILYPPNSSNLTKMINSFTSDITKNWTTRRDKKMKTRKVDLDRDSDIPALPFDLDLQILTGEKVSYTTYPFNVTFLPGSNANLTYSNDKFTLHDADFVSEEGQVELVGTILEVERIEISYNEKINDISLEAVFYKKVADGTQIQLLINGEGEGSFPNNLQMSLESDNPYDLSDAEKLFRLRYGRGLDDLTTQERNNLFQNDLLQTAGGEIENIIIDPMINKLELFISRNLNIDFFQMETSFIYNLLSNNSDLYGNQEDLADKYSADMLLENLSLKAGRYILDDLLLNYKITFQRVYDAGLQSEIGVYHTISFRYDLPMDIKFLYEYNIDPWQVDSHQYSFTRTVRFENLNDLIRKILFPKTYYKN